MKKLIAGLLTAGALGVTALAAAPAQAATNGMQAEFWPSTSDRITISGYNQNGVHVIHTWTNVKEGQEFKASGYWWKGVIGYSGDHSSPKTCDIPTSHPGDYYSCPGLTAN
ncbi:hypothetical protein [Catenulispora pinisilvae]|uniref:hypothetical protein n=1 Tax=Catenulispora pinisilvae TaxID=2705253 RepID=UPI0018915061|nr:hypothetical protein [Catenulispora pinisilvae]